MPLTTRIGTLTGRTPIGGAQSYGRPLSGLSRSYLIDRRRGWIFTPPQARGSGTVPQPRLSLITTPAVRVGDRIGFERPPVLRTIMPVKIGAPDPRQPIGTAKDALEKARREAEAKKRPEVPVNVAKQAQAAKEVEESKAADAARRKRELESVVLGAAAFWLVGRF